MRKEPQILHNHSAYSVIDGKATIESYMDLVAPADGPRLYGDFFALTDHGTLGSAIELYTQAKKHNIKPVIGCELYVDGVELRERSFPAHLTVLARNEAGYRALIAANNMAHRQFYYRPRLTLKQILDNGFAKDWLVLSGCMSSLFFDYPQSEAEDMVKRLAAESGRFFLEVMYHESSDQAFLAKQQMHLERVAALHKSTGIPLALTNDCHYSHQADEILHRKVLDESREPSGLEFDGQGFYFKTIKEMEEIGEFLNIPYALDNAMSAGLECDVVIPEADTLNWYVPDITGGQPRATLDALARTELYTLRQHGYGPEYEERYEHEMSVLAKSPAILNSYLVAHDVVSWCADKGISIAARGSMAGSLVSWLLGITLEDPIKYNLKFERAVNPARPTIPDFDLDVSSSRRGEVLAYLQERYTHNMPICAYSHYGPKGAFRKILRMEGKRDQNTINDLCRVLPDDWVEEKPEYNGTYTVGRDRRMFGPNAKDWREVVPEEYRAPVRQFKGLYANVSVHPSGIIVSGPERDPEHEIPLQYVASSKVLTSAFDMYTIKKIGLFKLDVLGLNTLDQLADMKRFSGQEAPINYDDPQVLAAFGADLLAEIFQMDGYSCREIIRSVGGINSFEDIVAVNTLARPGASQFTKYYRTGLLDITQQYPQLESVLGYTNGLILYQEQVMEIAQVLADFDDAEQDDIKEAIKYFRHEEFQKTIAPLFQQRCAAKGIDATRILERIVEFSKYTFNRAHAATYAALAYKMMWYKVYYPAAYYAAVFDAADDRHRLVLESSFFNVDWQPADINLSDYNTKVVGNQVLLGLGGIKGIGFETFKAIAANRPYVSVEDFNQRVSKQKCNVKARNILTDAYALAGLGVSGKEAAFLEFYGFAHSYLNRQQLKRLEAWESESQGRVAGYISSLVESAIKSPGANHGRLMGRAEIRNSRGMRKVVMFPDVWGKARIKLYLGAPVALVGSKPTEGDFVVDGGYDVSSLS